MGTEEQNTLCWVRVVGGAIRQDFRGVSFLFREDFSIRTAAATWSTTTPPSGPYRSKVVSWGCMDFFTTKCVPWSMQYR